MPNKAPLPLPKGNERPPIIQCKKLERGIHSAARLSFPPGTSASARMMDGSSLGDSFDIALF